jgi:hypothetical protein
MMEVMALPHTFQLTSHETVISPMYPHDGEEEVDRRCNQATSPQNMSSSDDPVVHDVQKYDILCGRDKITHSHVGNKRFRNIVMMHREDYQTATSREAKSKITFAVVAMIRQSGGRFLKQDEESGAWKNVGDEYARDKVSHALRSAKDPNRPRIRRRREAKLNIPTPEEDALFEATLSDQQLIFKGLLLQEAKKSTAGFDFGNIESILSKL